jgi:hypothetical protein
LELAPLATPHANPPHQGRVEDCRPLCVSEALTFQAHQMGALLAGVSLKIKGRLTPELVRRAADWLQRTHPVLRGHIVADGFDFTSVMPFVYPRYRFETRGTLPIPVESIIDARPNAGELEFQSQFRRPIPAGPSPRIRIALVRPSEDADTADLVVLIDHTVTDANSGMLVMRQMMEFFADPDGAPRPHGESMPLPPALDVVFPKKGSGKRPYQPTIRLPFAKLPKSEIGNAIERRIFTVAETAAIHAKIRAHRTTMHGVVAAAILKAMNQHFGLTEMTCLSSLDLRSQAKPPVGPNVFGCYVDLLRTKHDITQPIWKLSQDVAFKLITALARDQASASMLKRPTWEVIKAELWPMIKSGFRGDGLILTTAGETGLQHKFGDFELVDMIGSVSQEKMGAGFFGIALERAGELHVMLCYGAHAMAAEDARKMGDLTAHNLLNLPQ